MQIQIPVVVVVLTAALATQTAPVAQQAPASLVINGVTVIDGNGGVPIANATVVIEGARIARVGRPENFIPRDAQVIDGRGKFLIPGLIDVHVHLSGGSGNRANTQPITAQQELAGVRALHTFLYAGVTTIFDAGNQGTFIFALREKSRAGGIIS